MSAFARTRFLTSRPAWGGWIEISVSGIMYDSAGSRPAWGGWIEIDQETVTVAVPVVPPRMGRVD